MHSDVIAAIATGLIPGGIGIVRISGPGAVETAEKITEIKGLKLSEAVPRHRAAVPRRSVGPETGAGGGDKGRRAARGAR